MFIFDYLYLCIYLFLFVNLFTTPQYILIPGKVPLTYLQFSLLVDLRLLIKDASQTLFLN